MITTHKTYERTVVRLVKLTELINKNAHLWGESSRLFGWVDEYNNLRSEMSWEQWQQYCAGAGYDTGHDGYDCLA